MKYGTIRKFSRRTHPVSGINIAAENGLSVALVAPLASPLVKSNKSYDDAGAVVVYGSSEDGLETTPPLTSILETQSTVYFLFPTPYIRNVVPVVISGANVAVYPETHLPTPRQIIPPPETGVNVSVITYALSVP
ncbi:hypothetical protein YDC107_5437 [Escherichia phage YDC107_2]|nr:hypothetical protein YDC107_5437 [Escherichia phage YDC107_2]